MQKNMAQIATPRPPFEPSPCLASDQPLKEGWVPLISCVADFPPELFEIAIQQLIHHPEYNSTLILRSDVISDSTSPEDFPQGEGVLPCIHGRVLKRCIHRKLLPRRPGRDGALEQYCSLYAPQSEEDEKEKTHADDDADPLVDTLILTPIIVPGDALPYYHPSVSHIAFRFLHPSTHPSTSSTTPQIRIEALPLPGTPTSLTSRLYRTSLALLETVHRYLWGALTHYQKRVIHDALVPREVYQDTYLLMRERHAEGLVGAWMEKTDPLKHVYEDIAIATYLMLLWKEMFSTSITNDDTVQDPEQPWKSWPRPPGGFLDLGCGNGLLTHLLSEEGYKGQGIDLRARTSWASYPQTTQAQLRVHAFDPTSPSPSPSHDTDTIFPTGVFIIGNHSDELTPWLPILATLHRSSGYLSIPCCSWAFDTKYQRARVGEYGVPMPEEATFAEKLNLGGDGSNSSNYSAYRIWLAALSIHCGWEVETDMLRIPSTRNWVIVGRKESTSVSRAQAVQNAEAIVEGVQERGVFRTRRPEGKAGDAYF